MWNSSGTPERRAEVPEEDEEGGAPERPRADSLLQCLERRVHGGPVEARAGLVDRVGRRGERQGRKGRGEQERPRMRDVGRQVAAADPGDEAGGIDGAPLDRLEGAGQTPRLALLHHHRIAEDVGEREPEPGQAQDHQGERVGIAGQEAEDEPARRRHRGGDQEVGAATIAEQRDQVGEQTVERFDVPGEADEGQERRRLPGGELQLVLEEEEDRLGGQSRLGLGQALDGVDGGEEDRQPAEAGVPGRPDSHGGSACRQSGTGRRPRQGWTASKAAEAAGTMGSASRRPTICSPIGRPSAVNPHGTVAAGCIVRLNG